MRMGRTARDPIDAFMEQYYALNSVDQKVALREILRNLSPAQAEPAKRKRGRPAKTPVLDGVVA
jgi:hypothetical protein